MRQLEAGIQMAVIAQLHALGRPGWLYWANINQGKRSKHLGYLLKRQGLMPGLGDLSLVHQGCYYEIELKAPKGRLSPLQQLRGVAVEAVGGKWFVCSGLDDALKVLRQIGALR